MGKICLNCGNELSDNAKFCSKCGSKCEEVVQEKKVKRMCQKCGHELDEKMKFCPKCGTLMTNSEKVNQNEKRNIGKTVDMVSEGIPQAVTTITEGLKKGKEKFNEYQNLSEEEKREKKQQYIESTKEKSAEFVGDVKNFKTLPKKRKKKVIFTIGGILVLLLIFFSTIGNKGGSLTAEEKIEIAKNTVIDYLPAEELLSSGGVASVLWAADEKYVTAVRDGIKFRFSVNSDGSGYFDGAEKNGDEISPEALSSVLEQYYEIGQLSGTL